MNEISRLLTQEDVECLKQFAEANLQGDWSDCCRFADIRKRTGIDPLNFYGLCKLLRACGELKFDDEKIYLI